MNSTQNSQFLFSRPDEEIPVVESYLHSKFRPIKPRPDFVNSLKNRLSDPAGVKPSREIGILCPRPDCSRGIFITLNPGGGDSGYE